MTILSNFSGEPVININEENAVLIKKVTRLKQSIDLRQKAILAASYIKTCRFTEGLQGQLKELLALEDAFVFSLNQLCSIRLGIYWKKLKHQVDLAIEHIVDSQCTLCLAKGFFCEKCRGADLIFPFQKDIAQCEECFACFHQGCFKHPCGKCQRIQIREM